MSAEVDNVTAPDFRSVARMLTVVENQLQGSVHLLKSLVFSKNTPVIGITGPPGAGKSTLVNHLISNLLADNKTVAVLAIDPTSPFNFGSLLGDRIRMSPHFNNPNVFIRSLATRGSLGGLSAKTIEMTDVLRSTGFDYIIIETVGVGQSEVEIAGLADITFVLLVPESGDEIQNIKSGLMEIADAFIINKADRPGADEFTGQLKKLLSQKPEPVPIFRTIADKNEGIGSIKDFIGTVAIKANNKKPHLMAQKAYHLIKERRMVSVDKLKLQSDIQDGLQKDARFNVYAFAENYDQAFINSSI